MEGKEKDNQAKKEIIKVLDGLIDGCLSRKEYKNGKLYINGIEQDDK